MKKSTSLTAEQERDLHAKYKRTGRRLYRNKLIEGCLGYATSVVRAVGPKSWENTEIVSVATEGLLGAIEKFDATKTDGSFCVYARHWLKKVVRERLKENFCLDADAKTLNRLRANHERGGEVIQFSEVDVISECGDEFKDVASAAVLTDSADLPETFSEAAKLLTETEQVVIRNKYFERLSFAEIGRRMSPPISRELIRRAHNKAIKKLKTNNTLRELRPAA